MRFLVLVVLLTLLGSAVADDKVVLRVKPITIEEYKKILGGEEANTSEGRLISSILSGLSGLTAGLTMGKYLNSLLGNRDDRTVGGYPLCTINARPEARQMDLFSYDNLEQITNSLQSENGKPVINCVLVVDDRYSVPHMMPSTTETPMTGPTKQPPHHYPDHPQHPWYTHFLGYLQYPYPTTSTVPPLTSTTENPMRGPTFQPTPPTTTQPSYPYPHPHPPHHLQDPHHLWYSKFPDYPHYPYPPPTSGPLLTTNTEDTMTEQTFQPTSPPTIYPPHLPPLPGYTGYPGYPQYPGYSAYPGYPYFPYPPPQYPYQTQRSFNTDDAKEIERSIPNPRPEKPTYPPAVLPNYPLHSPSTNKFNSDTSTRRPRPRPRPRPRTQARRPFKYIFASPPKADNIGSSDDNVDYIDVSQRFHQP